MAGRKVKKAEAVIPANIVDHRQVIRDLITGAFAKNAKWSDLTGDLQGSIVRRAERDCHNYVVKLNTNDGIECLWTDIRFVQRYSTICYKLIANLDNESSVGSSYLADNIIVGNIQANTVAGLSSIEMCPDASKEIVDDIRIRQMQKVDIKVLRAYTCSKCNKNETTYLEYAGRAADEAMCVSIKCLHCRHTWRL